MKKIILEKKENNKILDYEVVIDRNIVTTTYGLRNGKKQVEKKIYSEGKNIGRANETSNEEQAMFEAARTCRKKIERNYVIISGGKYIDEQTSATVVATDTAVPMCMLAETLSKHLKKLEGLDKVDVQPKYDGNRCLINIITGKMYSRSRKEITSIPGLGDVVANGCKNLPKEVIWVDGEIYSDELTFNEIQSIIRKKEAHEHADKINFNMYDILTGDTWSERLDMMNDCIKFKGRLHEVPTYECPATYEAIDAYNREFVELGYEGVIIRLHDGKYAGKRTTALLKHKTFLDQEYEAVGFKSEKNRDNLLGAFILVTKTGDMFTARPACTDSEKAEMWANKTDYVGKWATIRFQEKDADTDVPRFPVLKGFRAESDIETGR